MPEALNPALKQFVAEIKSELVLAQVWIRRDGGGYELRNVADAESAVELRPVKFDEVRALSQFTTTGEFRPLKSAPTLQRGWQVRAANDTELETALSQLYPGAVADWFAVRSAKPPVTDYRAYTARQSGMYRITAMLDDTQAAQVIMRMCAPECCLKRRLWTVNGLAPDAAAVKSLIPCLEPCAVLMEAARQAMRTAQQEKAVTGLARGAEAS